MKHHHDGPQCELCDFKLCMAHPTLSDWFIAAKKHWPNMHTSCTFRDEPTQNKAFAEGSSMLRWPNSAHNFMKDSKPLSLAADIFQIDEDGVARFSYKFCFILWEWTQAQYGKKFMRWGGDFKTLGDSGHFQLVLPADDLYKH